MPLLAVGNAGTELLSISILKSTQMISGFKIEWRFVTVEYNSSLSSMAKLNAVQELMRIELNQA